MKSNKLVRINRRVYDELIATKPDYDSEVAYLSRIVEQALNDKKNFLGHYISKAQIDNQTTTTAVPAVDNPVVPAVGLEAVSSTAVTSTARALPVEE